MLPLRPGQRLAGCNSSFFHTLFFFPVPHPLPEPSAHLQWNNDTARSHVSRNVYGLRVLGMGLGGLLVASVLHDLKAPTLHWAVWVFCIVLWPHGARLLSWLSADPFGTEKRNLLIDSAIVGMLVPLMQFNLLASVVLVATTTSDKFSTGIRQLWLHSLLALLAAGVLTTLLLRPLPVLESSARTVVLALPIIVVHTLAVSFASYRLIRTVSQQNRQLQEMRRTDAHTGLQSRGHWQEQADALLRRHHASGEPACMLMIDIDHFKQINDTHGHTVGDEVIAAVGRTIRSCVRGPDCAGRYGGDEFAVVCGNTLPGEALAIAQRIRHSIEALRLPALEQLRLTTSIGLAPAKGSHRTLRDWLNDTDAALYRAKDGGRNQVWESPSTMPAPLLADA